MSPPNSNTSYRLVAELSGLSREELTPRLLAFPSRTNLDFTREFLDTQTTDQLRHILLAALLYLTPT